MITRDEEQGFFQKHWDWLAALVGVLALLAGAAYLVLSLMDSPETLAEEAAAQLGSGLGKKSGVEAVDLEPYHNAVKAIKGPKTIKEISEKSGSFLNSARRVICDPGASENKSCGQPIPADAKECPFCGVKQQEEKKVELDTDGDGIPDDEELRLGLDPKVADLDLDKDGDGFTNREELAAKTDLNDPKSHPSYLDYFRLDPELKEKRLPFYFQKTMEIPAGRKYWFVDPKLKNEYGQFGLTYTPMEGEEIGKTGFRVLKYSEKREKRKIKGGGGATKEVDVSFVTIERTSDKKQITLRAGEKHKTIDAEATLRFTRDGGKEWMLVPGSVFKVRDVEAKVKSIEKTDKELLLKVILTDSLKEKIFTAPLNGGEK